ncbi:SMI1/KNR4 family protein [Streptomyces sp. VRA16 Mangrove soil]|nr:SMI1/KNR4 family protein [Streptomyces sp. VRA16 Mangrove soil]
MLATFEETYGHPPGTNAIRPADEDDLAAARAYARESLGFEDLQTFYASIGEVSLPDVGNGFFLHSARDVLDRLAQDGPVALPEADDPLGMVIASNGGGRLYVADRGGAVHRSRTASVDDGAFDKVAGNLPEFLDLVLRSVVRFVETGEAGDL